MTVPRRVFLSSNLQYIKTGYVFESYLLRVSYELVGSTEEYTSEYLDPQILGGSSHDL